jgi:addiction module RelB/DinJ family antitoxin
MVYMHSTILSIKTTKELRDAAKATAQELGVPLSTAINAFLKQFVRDKELTLSVRETPSPYLKKVLEEAEEELQKPHKTFSSAEELMKDLNS